jgi:hypothetical protein
VEGLDPDSDATHIVEERVAQMAAAHAHALADKV